jgi:hypothetical protein
MFEALKTDIFISLSLLENTFVCALPQLIAFVDHVFDESVEQKAELKIVIKALYCGLTWSQHSQKKYHQNAFSINI